MTVPLALALARREPSSSAEGPAAGRQRGTLVYGLPGRYL